MAEAHLGPALSLLLAALHFIAHAFLMLPGLVAVFGIMGELWGVTESGWYLLHEVHGLFIPRLRQLAICWPGVDCIRSLVQTAMTAARHKASELQVMSSSSCLLFFIAGAIYGRNPFAILSQRIYGPSALDSGSVNWRVATWPPLFLALYSVLGEALGAVTHMLALVLFKRLVLGRLPPGKG